MYWTFLRAVLVCGLATGCGVVSSPPSGAEQAEDAAVASQSPDPLPPPVPLPEGTVVVGASVLRDVVGFWPPESYGGWDTTSDDRYELVVETKEELIVIDTQRGEVATRVARPDAFQINAVLATNDSLWISDHDAGEVVRIDRESGQTVARVEVGGRAVSLLETREGVWAGSGHAVPESVVLIDSRTNRAGRRIEAGAYPGYGLDSLWFGRDETRSTLAGIRRIDPATGDLLATIDLGEEADGCYVGGSFPDAVWSYCYPPPPGVTRAGRLDVDANQVTATVRFDAAGSLIGAAEGFSYFLVDATADVATRLVQIDNATNDVHGVHAFDTPPPPFDMAAIIGDALWFIDVEDGEVRTVALSELDHPGQDVR